MEEKVQLSWQDIERLAQQLADKVVASGFRPDCLVGITSGGLIPLALLAKRLNVSDLMTVSASSYADTRRGELSIKNVPSANLKGRAVLLVDEIADSGRTLGEVSRVLSERCSADTLKTATLVVRSDRCKTPPDFSALEADRWVVFPWE